ncbi:MAG TPA: hypothetical protein VHJ76_04785 [Actinomycetota bacterium]|nr:hypothetical protein [Actinomycetota bacterium]
MTARDWDRLPPVDRALADEMPLVVDHDATRAALPSHARPEPLLGSLGHTVSPDGPGGIVWGLPVSLRGPEAVEPVAEDEPFEIPAGPIVFERPARVLAAFAENAPEAAPPLTRAEPPQKVFRSLGPGPESGPGPVTPPPAAEVPSVPVVPAEPPVAPRPLRLKGVLGAPLPPNEPPRGADVSADVSDAPPAKRVVHAVQPAPAAPLLETPPRMPDTTDPLVTPPAKRLVHAV